MSSAPQASSRDAGRFGNDDTFLTRPGEGKMEIADPQGMVRVKENHGKMQNMVQTLESKMSGVLQ